MSQAAKTLPPYHRNAIALICDFSLFSMAMSFIGVTTVLPSFLATLTHSALIVGIGSGITRGAWLLPQLLVAGVITKLPYRKPLIVGAAWASRPILLLIAWAVWRYSVVAPGVTLALVLGGLFILFAADAVASVPWFDHLARTIPAQRRGMIIGAGQIIGGLGGIGIGALVRFVLSAESPWAYPVNYALIFGAGGVLLLLSAVALCFLSNPRFASAEASKRLSLGEQLRMLPALLTHDRPFRQLVGVQLLVGFIGVASAFYVLYAQSKLGLGVEDTGLFVSAQVAGSVTAGLLLGYIQHRWGPLKHIRLQIIIAIIPPMIALLAGSRGVGALPMVRVMYGALYFVLGIYMSGMGWPFFNWLLEYAPEAQRPLYVGLMNTLSAATMFAPALGGWVVANISYEAVFILAAVLGVFALVASRKLPSTRT